MKIRYLKSGAGKMIDWQDGRFSIFLIKEDFQKIKKISEYLQAVFVEEINLKNRIDGKLSGYSVKYRLYKKS